MLSSLKRCSHTRERADSSPESVAIRIAGGIRHVVSINRHYIFKDTNQRGALLSGKFTASALPSPRGLPALSLVKIARAFHFCALSARKSPSTLAELALAEQPIPRPDWSRKAAFQFVFVRECSQRVTSMRRVLFGLLTFGACATNAAALAEELSAMDDFATSPLRKTLDPQVEIFPLALEDRRTRSARERRDRRRAGGFDDIRAHRPSRGARSTYKPRARRRNSRQRILSARHSGQATNNVVGRKPNLNALLGYQTIVDAIKFQGWFGAAGASPNLEAGSGKQAPWRRRWPWNHMGTGRRAEPPNNVFCKRLLFRRISEISRRDKAGLRHIGRFFVRGFRGGKGLHRSLRGFNRPLAR